MLVSRIVQCSAIILVESKSGLQVDIEIILATLSYGL